MKKKEAGDGAPRLQMIEKQKKKRGTSYQKRTPRVAQPGGFRPISRLLACSGSFNGNNFGLHISFILTGHNFLSRNSNRGYVLVSCFQMTADFVQSRCIPYKYI
jgi:hypothetical protein